ncbi:hypothetical protein C8Q79DRAFT_1014626 [Trametes meyenii]|nr:hypothetical protein C8Q79DRAFT_1014626 [Trametes meyenii]
MRPFVASPPAARTWRQRRAAIRYPAGQHGYLDGLRSSPSFALLLDDVWFSGAFVLWASSVVGASSWLQAWCLVFWYYGLPSILPVSLLVTLGGLCTGRTRHDPWHIL